MILKVSDISDICKSDDKLKRGLRKYEEETDTLMEVNSHEYTSNVLDQPTILNNQSATCLPIRRASTTVKLEDSPPQKSDKNLMNKTSIGSLNNLNGGKGRPNFYPNAKARGFDNYTDNNL